MAIDVHISDHASGADVDIYDTFNTDSRVVNGGVALSVIDPNSVFGQFKAANRTSAGTTIIAEPLLDGSIGVTDLIISADKVNGATVTVRFTDGTNTINLYRGITTDAPINVSIPIGGRFRGWANARLELVTTNAVDASVTLGYIKYSEGLQFSPWDKLR